MLIAQEFIVPSDADNAPEHLKGHPASMRLLIDFRYLESGKIQKIFEAAYQRISPFLPNYQRNPFTGGLQLPAYQDHTLEDFFVVNKTRGALSASASDRELQSAREVSIKIIENLARINEP